MTTYIVSVVFMLCVYAFMFYNAVNEEEAPESISLLAIIIALGIAFMPIINTIVSALVAIPSVAYMLSTVEIKLPKHKQPK